MIPPFIVYLLLSFGLLIGTAIQMYLEDVEAKRSTRWYNGDPELNYIAYGNWVCLILFLPGINIVTLLAVLWNFWMELREREKNGHDT